MEYKVALLGPNDVGKSELFYKISGKEKQKSEILQNMPQDRIKRKIEKHEFKKEMFGKLIKVNLWELN